MPFLELDAFPAVAEVGVGAPDAPPPSLSLSLNDVDRGVGANDPGVECVVDPPGVWASCCYCFARSVVSRRFFHLLFGCSWYSISISLCYRMT